MLADLWQFLRCHTVFKLIIIIFPVEPAHTNTLKHKVKFEMTGFYCSPSKYIGMKNTSKILVALGAGLAIGGLLGVLFAPDKGSNTRHKIVEGGKKFTDKIKEKVKAGKEKMEERFSRVNGEMEENA
jgi:gas vesicle protein